MYHKLIKVAKLTIFKNNSINKETMGFSNIFICFGITLFLASCSSSPNVVNNYYINGKKVNENKLKNQQIAQNDSINKGNNSEETWVNPLNTSNSSTDNLNNKVKNNTNDNINSEENNDSERVNIYGGNVVINNTPSHVYTNYVPVINPWWNNWSVISYSPFYGFGYSSPCVIYDWYSPWYNFHPFYGNSWIGRPAWGYWSWCNQPLYSFYPRRLNGSIYRNYYPDFDNYRHGNMSNRNNYGSRNESYGYSNNTINNSRNNTTSIYRNSNSALNNQGNSSSRNGIIRAGYVSESPSSRNGNVYNSNNNIENTGNKSSRNIYGGNNSGLGNTNGNIENGKNGSNGQNDNNSSRNNTKRNTENSDIFKSRDNQSPPKNNTPLNPPTNNGVNKGSRSNGGNSVNPMPSKNTSPPVAVPSNSSGSSRNGRR